MEMHIQKNNTWKKMTSARSGWQQMKEGNKVSLEVLD